MSQKLVLYQDLFDSSNIILAKNKLKVTTHRDFFKPWKHSEICKCHNYTPGPDGKCTNRTCDHDAKDHDDAI